MRTGKRLWHFQMVHHDIWDYDDATAPKLLTVRHEGKLVDVVAQVSKQGFIWVFNRVTGEPLADRREGGPEIRDVRGRNVGDTTFSRKAASFRAAEVHGRRFESASHTSGPCPFSR